MDALCYTMALMHQGFARGYAFGPYDPTQSNPAAAWKVPVRRISERYYLGWRVKKVRQANWQSYNASKEAYYIEYGIHGWKGAAGRRIRRPINKLSYLRVVRAMRLMDVNHRIWASMYYEGGRMKGGGFLQYVQGGPASTITEVEKILSAGAVAGKQMLV